MDNLRVHKATIVKEKMQRLNFYAIFNASYSSEYNPIERLWLFSKRHWRKQLFDYKTYSNRQRMFLMVE